MAGSTMRRVKDAAIVTGAASGIGRAVVDRMRGARTDILAVDRDGAALATIEGIGVRTLVADLATVEGRDEVVSRADGCRYLVNAAGIIRIGSIFSVTMDDIREMYAMNVDATWDLTSRIGSSMKAGGAIVNLGSSAAKLASTTEAAAYASSKAAVLSLTRSFAYALAPRNVRVNAVCPGNIMTPMEARVLTDLAIVRGDSVDELRDSRESVVPPGRAGSAGECAEVIWFLLSGRSSYVTGQSINVTGGLVTW